jgi:hypothetical protein
MVRNNLRGILKLKLNYYFKRYIENYGLLNHSYLSILDFNFILKNLES